MRPKQPSAPALLGLGDDDPSCNVDT